METQSRRPSDLGFLVLYKFMPLEAAMKTIENGEFKVSLPNEETANDPFEFNPAYSEDADEDEFSKQERKDIREIPFMSFCKCYDDSAMWGRYADGGKGVCFQLVFPIFQVFPLVSVVGTPCPRISCGHVNSEGKCLHEFDVREVEYSDKRPGMDDILKIFQTKNTTWESEKEYRIVYSTSEMKGRLKKRIIKLKNRNKGEIFVDVNLFHYVTSIILGCKCKYSVNHVMRKLNKNCSFGDYSRENLIRCSKYNNYDPSNVLVLRVEESRSKYKFFNDDVEVIERSCECKI